MSQSNASRRHLIKMQPRGRVPRDLSRSQGSPFSAVGYSALAPVRCSGLCQACSPIQVRTGRTVLHSSAANVVVEHAQESQLAQMGASVRKRPIGNSVERDCITKCNSQIHKVIALPTCLPKLINAQGDRGGDWLVIEACIPSGLIRAGFHTTALKVRSDSIQLKLRIGYNPSR